MSVRTEFDASTGSFKRARRRGLIAVAAATVFAAASITAAVIMSPSGGPTATQVAEDYLKALAAGDSQTALRLSAATPASSALLTDDVLRRQLQKTPISDIRVDGVVNAMNSPTGRVFVKASARFGSRPASTTIAMVQSGGSWKLASGFLVAEDPGHGIGGSIGRAFDTLEVFDVAVGPDGSFSVFPGALSLSTSNPFLDVTQSPGLPFESLRYGDQPIPFSPVFSLNDNGKRAVREAITDWVTACYTPGATPSGPCGKLDPTRGGQYVAGTSRLVGPIDFGQWTYTLDQSLKVVVANNDARVPVRAQRPDGSVEDWYWVGFTTPVDIGQDPPVVLPPS